MGWRAGGVPLAAAVGAGSENAAGSRGPRRVLHAGRPAPAAAAALLPH